MPSEAEQLQTIKSQTLALLAELTATPKPSYSIDGQEVSWGDYLSRLQATVAWCDEKLASHEPFEERSQGFSP